MNLRPRSQRYVELSSLMLVLTPVCAHVDTKDACSFASWRMRGWCRMELAAALAGVLGFAAEHAVPNAVFAAIHLPAVMIALRAVSP